MAETFRVPNFDSNNLKEVTILDADASAGQSQVTVLNTATYQAGDIGLLGMLGHENAELAAISSIAGKVFTLSANLSNNHSCGETFTLLFGSQIRLYRATNVDGSVPADSDFSYIDVSATIQGDDTTTDLTDPAGGSGYWYKTTYYNVATGAETSLAASVAARGGNYGRIVSVSAIRRESGLTDNRTIDDGQIAERRDQAEAEVLGALAAAGYTIPLTASNGNPYVPPMVENITRLLAAGYMLAQEFQPSSTDDVNPGKGKIKQAHQMLESIQKQVVVLLDTTGASLARTSQISGWPDSMTERVGTDGITGEPFQMTMSKQF